MTRLVFAMIAVARAVLTPPKTALRRKLIADAAAKAARPRLAGNGEKHGG